MTPSAVSLYNPLRDHLIDTGPLVALILKTDPNHNRILQALRTISAGSRLVTTWPCVTEATYFVGKAGGWQAQSLLGELVNSGKVLPHEILAGANGFGTRVFEVMERYSDLPCDFADASLIVTADNTGLNRILTFDGHFYAYRLKESAFTVSSAKNR